MNERGSTVARILPGLLVAATILVFLPCLRNGFVSWDDPRFILDNPVIRSLSAATIGAMFTQSFDGNYIPLTILSFALNHAWVGLEPWGYHATNVLIHAVNVVLVVLLFRRLGMDHVSAVLAAALFALHPLRVESVAWATERKDVLFAAFYLSALVAYVGHLRRNNGEFPWLVLVLAICSLLSKPMAMSLPLVLLILDHWHGGRPWRVAVREKIPFLAATALCAIITVVSQAGANAIRRDDITALVHRPILAGNSLMFYVREMVWPFNLSSLHPYPESLTGDMIAWAVAAVVLAAVVVVASRRYRVVGYASAYFVVTLLPVLNVIPAGGQMVADRFTYLPSLGPSLLLALAIRTAWRGAAGAGRVTLVSATCLLLAMLGAQTTLRCGVWRNDETLWTDSLKSRPDSFIAWSNLGNYYVREGRYDEGIDAHSRAIELWPNVADAYYNRALALRSAGRPEDALADLDRAQALDADSANTYYVRAQILAAKGMVSDALADYARALSLQPRWPELYAGRAEVLARIQRHTEALVDMDEALRLAPGNPQYLRQRDLILEALPGRAP